PDGAGPCAQVSDQVTVRINPLPEVTLFLPKREHAENDPIVTLGGSPTPGIFTGPGITAGTNEFNPANAGTGIKQLRYTHTDANGCTNVAVEEVIVNPVTRVEFTIEQPSRVDATGRLVTCEDSGNNSMLRLIGNPAWTSPFAKNAL